MWWWLKYNEDDFDEEEDDDDDLEDKFNCPVLRWLSPPVDELIELRGDELPIELVIVEDEEWEWFDDEEVEDESSEYCDDREGWRSDPSENEFNELNDSVNPIESRLIKLG